MWECLVDAYVLGRTKVSPLNAPVNVSSFQGLNEDFDFYVNEVSKRNWRCINAHEARVYLIQTPKNQSIVWISWLGYRGSRWHVVQHFPLTRAKLSMTARKVASDLVERYQEKWSIFIETTDIESINKREGLC